LLYSFESYVMEKYRLNWRFLQRQVWIVLGVILQMILGAIELMMRRMDEMRKRINVAALHKM
jgi:hypothetical protein